MEYTSEFDSDSGLCTIRVAGRHKRPEDSIVLQEHVRSVGEERGARRFLIDMTRAEIIARPMDTIRAGEVPVDFGVSSDEYRVALVYSGSLADHKLLESVAVNRGYHIRVFDNFDEATDWLQGMEDAY